MNVHVQKWGNSLALRIPHVFAKQTHLRQGSTLDFFLEENKLILKPIRTRKYSLNKLLLGINKKNIHTEQDFGSPQGKEIW